MANMLPDLRGLEELLQARSRAPQGDLPPPAERKALRVRAGLTQADLAGPLKVHPETLGRWERGDGRPSRRAAAAYVAALELLRRSLS